MPTSSTKKSPTSLRSMRWEKYYRHYIWNKEQAYEGEFFRDSLHGEGTYKWENLAVYEGGFYSNYKEGYAVMSFPDNSIFEGLFVRNQRFGPGVFTYPNGRQDVGFWMGSKLVRLSRAVDYIIPRLAHSSAAEIKLLQFRRIIPITEEPIDSVSEIPDVCKCCSDFLSSPYSRVIRDPRSIFFDKYAYEKSYFLNSKNIREETSIDSGRRILWNQELDQVNEEKSLTPSPVPSHCVCRDKEFLMDYQPSDFVEPCEGEDDLEVGMGILAFFRQYDFNEELGGNNEKLSSEDAREEVDESLKPTRILAWNRNELFVRMLQEIFRYKAFEGKLSFNIAKLMLGVRNEFRKTGEKEKECLEFLRTCAMGPPHILKSMLCHYDVSEELTDGRGNNSMMFAAATDQHEIIDALLDFGVDVNSFNDENLTPLNMCLLRRLAIAFELSDWETAFLPPEIKQNFDGDQEEEEWQKWISVSSLNKFFGDGSSYYENKYQAHDKRTSSNKQKSQRDKETVNKGVNESNENLYFFKLAPIEKHVVRRKLKSGKAVSIEELEEEAFREDYFGDDEIRSRIREIDKTIEKLLRRGADPNIAEVPKPSIHLGVYTRNAKIVDLLQSYGANPNAKLYPNEGLLTPLHLVVLLKPSTENIRICKLLLKYGADPEEKTHPEFTFYEGEQQFLDPREGRTPLQLLCMRPDLEYADPEGHSTKIGLLLCERCKRERLYNDHSYLSLAMYFGNVKLLRAMVCSNLFDLNAELGGNRGSLLHVLLSTEFQKRTSFRSSTLIFDHVKKAGANLNKYSEKLSGNFIDFGRREIETEKESRIFLAENKKEQRRGSLRKSKVSEKDYLVDHEKLLKYVTEGMEGEEGEDKRSEEKGTVEVEEKKEKGKKEIEKERERRKEPEREKEKEREQEMDREQEKEREKGKEREQEKEREKGKGREQEKERVKEKERETEKQRKEVEAEKIEKIEEEEIKIKEKEEKIEMKNKEKKEEVAKVEKDAVNVNEKKGSKKKTEKVQKEVKAVAKRVLISDSEVVIIGEKLRERRREQRNAIKNEVEYKQGQIELETGKDEIEEYGESKYEDEYEARNEDKKKNAVAVFWSKYEAPALKGRRGGSVGAEKRVERENAKNRQKDKKEERNLRRQDQPKELKKSDASLKSRSFVRSLGGKQSSSLEAFPENLRQSILKLLGNYSDLDLNELFLPYVVLRDGDLYYGFKRKSSWGKEQYSLV